GSGGIRKPIQFHIRQAKVQVNTRQVGIQGNGRTVMRNGQFVLALARQPKPGSGLGKSPCASRSPCADDRRDQDQNGFHRVDLAALVPYIVPRRPGVFSAEPASRACGQRAWIHGRRASPCRVTQPPTGFPRALQKPQLALSNGGSSGMPGAFPGAAESAKYSSACRVSAGTAGSG